MLWASMGIGGGAFAIYLCLHILLIRLARPRLYFVRSFQLFLAMVAITAWRLIMGGFLYGFAFWNSFFVFGSLWVLYMELTFNAMRSVSVRTMVEIIQSPRQRISDEALERIYQTERMFDRRIESMIANGYLKQTDGRLMLSAKGALLGRVFTCVRRLLNVRQYG